MTRSWIAVLALASLVLSSPRLAAQQRGATIAGRVLHAETGSPLPDVVVRIEGLRVGVLTDSLGRYRISDIRPGPAVLRAERIGFAPARVPITVPSGGVLTRDIELAVQALEMEAINVTADAASRAEGELGTASVIGREAIEHVTATSLSGVLEFVPGVSVQQPGLDNVEQISLRFAPTASSLFASGAGGGTNRTSSDIAAFGTLIVLDGVPVSNNANLQTLGPRGELGFTTSAGGGIDLRRIPASTLERVEVIRGIPSVRWGDLTQGAIIVETRAASVAPIFAGKFDPRTAEGSTVGGRSFAGERQAGTVTFDVARTRTQPGISDDVASRVTTQLAHRAQVGGMVGPRGAEPRLELDTRLDFFQLIDDRPENPDVRPERAFRSRDRGFRVSERANLRLARDFFLSLTSAASVVQQSSESRAPKVAGTQPFTDRLTEGRSEGRYIGGFFTAEVDVEGEPWLLFNRLEADARRGWLGADHRVRLGAELRREWNSGPGLQFDIDFPPQVTFNGVRGYDRPRSYDEIPPLVTSALYLDDRVSAELAGLPVNLQAGLRLDLLHDGRSWFSEVQDEVLQARTQVELLPRPWLRLRAGWGRTAKTPSMGDLFPAPQYFDLVNVNFFANDPAERLAVLTTFIRDPTNPELGFSRGEKAEVGIELGFGETAISLVAFRDEVEGAVDFANEPDFLLRENFELENTAGDGMPPTLVEPAASVDTIPILVQRPGNILDIVSRGLELTATLPELEPLATRLQVTGSWVKTETSSDARFFGTRLQFDAFQLLPAERRTPYWEGLERTGERALFLYRLIHHQPVLGLAITGTIQHNITDEFVDASGADTLAFAGYLTRDARLVPVPESERGNPEFEDLRKPRAGTTITARTAPADWMMSLQVSKTLPIGGRLNFWAFNFLDRRGVSFGGVGRLGRSYPPIRFGFELSLPTSQWLGW